jgi:type I restriction enzyme, S subunit
LRSGDIVIEKSGGGEQQPVGRAALFDLDCDAVPTNFAARLRPADGNEPRFLTYLLSSLYASGTTRSVIKQTTGIQNLDLEAFLGQLVLVPPEQKQREIADFLYWETARIDALIEKKRRLADALEERFVAALASALDRLPKRRLRTLTTKIGSGKTPLGGAETYVFQGVLFIRSQNVLMGRLDLSDVAFIKEEIDEQMHNTRVLGDDVLLNITGASLGRCATAPLDLPAANVNQHVCIIRPSRNANGQLLQFAIRSKAVQDQIREEQLGGNRDGLTFEQVGDLVVSVPEPVDAQARLATELRHIEARHQVIADRLNLQLKLLQEHRQALITAAVTGEVGVKKAAAA